MSKKLILIVPYFGKLPNYFKLWLKSCDANRSINWIIFTDDTTEYTYPKNVIRIIISFDQLREKISNIFNFEIKLDTPYKLCDYKVAYGVIFNEFIKGYDFWGYCDLDMIFGDLRKFITDNVLNKYNKILNRGHLTIYKNTNEVNNYFKLKFGDFDYRRVFSTDVTVGFDEWNGIHKILKYHGIDQYHDEFICDINYKVSKLKNTNSKNYKHQVFYWDNGKVYHQYLDKDGLEKRNEVAYIHFQKRVFYKTSLNNEASSSFYITPYGFIDKNELELTKSDYIKYNKVYLNQLIFLNKRRLKRMSRILSNFGRKRPQ